MSERLPPPRAVLTALFGQLPKQSGDVLASVVSDDSGLVANPLRDLSHADKQLFVTLHCIFPNEFLPALDLLDRRLVTRLIPGKAADAPRGAAGSVRPRSSGAYYVRSSQPPSRSRYLSSSRTSYEVRVKAWNCTCPAFAFSAFGGASLDSNVSSSEGPQDHLMDSQADAFGGLSLGDGVPPVCKHLLACVVAENCGDLLEDYVTELETSREELAGWATGWGD